MASTKSELVMIEDVHKTAWREFWRNRGMLTALFVCTGLSILIIWIISQMEDPGDTGELLIWIWVIFTAIVSGFIKKIRSRMIRQYAEANGFTYSEKGSLTPKDGSIFNHGGHSEEIIDMVSGSLNAAPFKFFHYIYVTGSGKNRTSHHHSVMALDFKGKLPHVIVDSKSFTSLSFPYARDQLIELESNEFNRYFHLYVPKGYQVEALSILTPDVMAQLIDKSSLYDVEFINNRVYIYCKSLVNTRAKLQALHELADTIVNELAGKLDRFKSAPPAQSAAPVSLQRSLLGSSLNSPQAILAVVFVVVMIAVTAFAFIMLIIGATG
jgi:hypothetical protein